MALYELALMGDPSRDEVAAVEACLSSTITPFGLKLGVDVVWNPRASSFDPNPRTSAAVAFFGKPGASADGVGSLLARGIPIIPVAQSAHSISADLPDVLKPFNCLTFIEDGALRVTTALLECVGLLPRQRRVFVSYRRDEAKEAALQLFNHLSGKIFDVFLDTHGILPAEDFQGVLWHKLCDSDVLIMLDTPNYFDSRWTSAEFGRALSKGISILRVEWPGVVGCRRTATTSGLSLSAVEVNVATGKLTDEALGRIGEQVEIVRAQSQAVRHLNLFSALKRDVECVGGTVTGVGVHKAVSVRLAGGQEIVIYPTLGVPTSMTLNEVAEDASGKEAAILYDHIGLQERWLRHLKWLGENIPAARWVRTSEAAWDFGGWGTP
jgi:TIR domain